MTKLEGLLREADDRRVRLETRVADAQKLEWALRQRIEELERRLRDLGQPAPAPPTPVQERTAAPAPAPPPPQEARRTDSDEFAAVLHASILREQARAAMPLPPQPAPAPPAPMPAEPGLTEMPPAPPAPERAAVQPPVTDMTAAPPVLQPEPAGNPELPEEAEDDPFGRARTLLRAGRSIEQVARETGVEIGALRLMKQMAQRD